MKKALGFLIALLVLSLALTSCGSQVPRPEIKSGEFNYSVTYEYKGELKTVSGVYVCEYADTSWTLDGGHTRDWNGYIKGADDNDFVLIDVLDGGDEVSLVLNLDPEYFMDDYNSDLYGIPEPYIQITDYTEDGGFCIIYEAAEVEEICGAKIISFEYDSPIENDFKVFYFN